VRKSISVVLAGAILAGLAITSVPASAQTLRIGIHRALIGSWEVIADKKGYWKEEGLKYTTQNFAQGKLMRNAIIQGNLDTGTTGFSPYVTAISKGAKVEAVGVTMNICGTQGVFVPVNSPAKTVKDLKGKTIATKTGTSVDFAFKQYVLPHNGLKISDMKWLSVNTTQRVATIIAGQAQGAIIGDPQAEIAVQKGIVRKLEDFCAYDKTRMMHIANPKTYKEHPELYVKYFRGWLKAHELLQKNPEEFARVYTKWLNDVGNTTTYEVILPVVKRIRSEPFITAEVEAYLNDMADKQQKLGWIKSHPDFRKVSVINDKELRVAAKEMGIDVRTAEAK
jgi:ABC-type nitrate/sulfonate/bicarbonate transport system substrate-binding protein